MSSSVRTFRAPSTREALEIVKRELGPDAVILGTRWVSGTGLGRLARRPRVEISAAPPGFASPAPRLRATAGAPGRAATAERRAGSEPVTTDVLPPGVGVAGAEEPAGSSSVRVPQTLYPLYVRLVENEVAADLAARLVREAAARVSPSAGDDTAALRQALRDYIAGMLPESGGVQLAEGTTRRVALIGPPGAGKTTALAKLAAHFKLRQERRLALLSLDLHRLGSHEQLRRYADILEVPLHTAQTLTEAKQCLAAAGDLDLLLIDTVGVGLRDQARFARLASLLRAVRPDEIHLVMPASLTPEVQARVAQSFAPLGPARVLLTRLDDAVGFGVILNVVQRLNLPPSYLSTGQNVPNDLEEACGPRLAALICPADG